METKGEEDSLPKEVPEPEAVVQAPAVVEETTVVEETKAEEPKEKEKEEEKETLPADTVSVDSVSEHLENLTIFGNKSLDELHRIQAKRSHLSAGILFSDPSLCM